MTEQAFQVAKINAPAGKENTRCVGWVSLVDEDGNQAIGYLSAGRYQYIEVPELGLQIKLGDCAETVKAAYALFA